MSENPVALPGAVANRTADRTADAVHGSRSTMRDVARHAGVGLSTVSRVVNGDTNVSQAKTRAVEAAIRTLRFRRNDSARTLRMGDTASIGLLIESVSDPFFSLLNQAVEEVTLSRDSLLLSGSSHQSPERAKKMLLAFSSRQVAGLIVTPSEPQDIDYLRTELAAGVKMVFVDRPVPGLDADTVLTDNFGGARSGVSQLLKHGHARIAFFSDRSTLYTTSHRKAGYAAALAQAGIGLDPALVHSSDDGTYSFAEPLAAMLALADPPTAIFSSNNRSTIEILREFASGSRRLALVGFDDFELADAMNPGVTVVAQDPMAMGRTAAELLFSRLDGARGPTQTVSLSTTLIPRGSGERHP